MQSQPMSDERLTIVLPAGATLAIERAAFQARVTPSELMRRAVHDGLRTWGLQLVTRHKPNSIF